MENVCIHCLDFVQRKKKRYAEKGYAPYCPTPEEQEVCFSPLLGVVRWVGQSSIHSEEGGGAGGSLAHFMLYLMRTSAQTDAAA